MNAPAPFQPVQVIPEPLARAVDPIPYWFPTRPLAIQDRIVDVIAPGRARR